MHPERARSGQTIAAVPLDRLLNRAHLELPDGVRDGMQAALTPRGVRELRRQMLDPDATLPQQDESVFDDVLELPDVAGVVIAAKSASASGSPR